MAEDKKPKKQKCKVVRAFRIAGQEVPVKVNGKQNYIDLDEPFAIEMKASLKVEFVGKDEKETEEPKETK